MTRSVLPLGLIFVVGCSIANSQSFSIIQNEALSEDSNACVASATATTARNRGVLDLGLVAVGGDGYNLYPLIRNNLLDRSATVPAGTDDIAVLGLDVQLLPDAALALVLPTASRNFFAGSFGGVIGPTDETAMGALVIPRAQALTLSDAVTADLIDAPELTVRVRAVGTRQSEKTHSNWITYPVQICRWCLTGGVPPACPDAGYKTTDVEKGGCGVDQDEAVTCCVNADGVTLCGADVPQSS